MHKTQLFDSILSKLNIIYAYTSYDKGMEYKFIVMVKLLGKSHSLCCHVLDFECNPWYGVDILGL